MPKSAALALVLLLPAFLVVSACAPLLKGYNGPGVRLFVANEAWDVVDVIVDRDGREVLLGRVWKDEYKTFELAPVDAGSPARVVVTAVSERDGVFQTDTIHAGRGTAIDLRLQVPLRHSRWWHY